MKKAKQKGLSEKQIGYLMVFPALLIILVIAIWPVARSFWISLYDVRLNEPTKSQIYNSYGIDMERYVTRYPLLVNNIQKELKNAKPADQKKIGELKTEVDELHANLTQDSALAKRYDEIDQLLFDFKPVPSDLKFIDLKDDRAKELKSTMDKIEQDARSIGDQKLVQKPEDLVGLVKGVEASIIEPNFTGLTYYKQFLTDKRMWASLSNTLVFTLISVAVELALGLWIALLINKQFRGRSLVRAAVLIPWAIPTVISALMWKFLYDGQNGIIAHVMTLLHLTPASGTLLTTKVGAMFSVILADVWKTTPFMALLLFAGLQTIPQSLYEAAEVDGASRRQQFFSITLPMLKSSIMVALLFRTLDAFRVFDLIYVLTGGGPANSTETISIYAYKTMFAQMNFGAGSALSVIVFLCVALISIGYIKILGADVVGDNNGR
jgi:multiple sugar transport system permease protein